MADVKLRIVGECIIEVGRRELRPDAPHLFALLLYLALERGREVQRPELFDLLFSADDSPLQRAHNLRQLVYRLRKVGVPIDSSGGGLALKAGTVESPIAHFEAIGRDGRSRLSAHLLAILPGYYPDISDQLRDWLDVARASAAARVRSILLADMKAAQTESEWAAVVRIGALVQQIDGANAVVVADVAQAFLMLGRKDDALRVIDAYLAEPVQDDATTQHLRRVRSRIDKADAPPTTVQATFRGREETFGALRTAWSHACAGRSHVCVVLGAPGIGKTRLAEEFARYATLLGGQTLTYRCDETDAKRPLSAFTHLVPELRALRGSLGASPELQHCLDLVSEIRHASAVLEPASLEATRSDILLALVDLIDAVTAEQPLLLVIDDAHQLDPTSCAVLGALSDRDAGRALLVLCCSRGGSIDRLALASCGQVDIQRLNPLSTPDSRLLLTELLSRHHQSLGDTEWCLAQAAGNPFYLHALARHGMACSKELPFDIRRLASSAYFALGASARTILEASLFLGRYATLRRVREVAQINGPSLLAALRAVEDSGLITFVDGELRLTHALLEDAIISLVPPAVAAELRARVALCLQSDYEQGPSALPVAWAAAENWMAAGDNGAAMKLLRLCASQAVGIGEPRTAARTLLLIPRAGLHCVDRVHLLSKVCEYAEAGGDYEVLSSSLRELLALQQEAVSERGVIQELELKISEVAIKRGDPPARAVEQLLALLADSLAAPQLRARAGTRLLILADLQLDPDLASHARRLLQPLLAGLPSTDQTRARAELVYHTAFGDREHAVTLAVSILRQHPEPSLSTEILLARKKAAFTLSRLTRGITARQALIQDYGYMLAHHVTTEALDRSIMLAENALADGGLSETAAWLDKAREILTKEPCSRAAARCHSTLACLAIVQGRCDEAERRLDEARGHCPAIASPRWTAVELAFRIRIRVARGESVERSADLASLRRHYNAGSHLGAQDYIVEALWHAERARGDVASASALLSQYLFERRREFAAPEWPFRTSTASDQAWTRYARQTKVSSGLPVSPRTCFRQPPA